MQDEEKNKNAITCENAAKQLQDGSDYLSEQVRLYAMTEEVKYMDLYFTEANKTRRRENALEELRIYFDGTKIIKSLQNAMECSRNLMATEYYSMRLTAEASGMEKEDMPEEIAGTILLQADQELSDADKLRKAREIVCDDTYQDIRNEIKSDVTECMNGLLEKTRNSQRHAITVFSDMYRKLEIGVAVLSVLCYLCVWWFAGW